MSGIDDTIRRAIDEETEMAMLEFTRRETMLSQVRGMLRGTSVRLTVFAMLIMLVLTAFAVVSAVQFFAVESPRAQLAWAVGFIMAFVAHGLLKLWFWMLNNRNTVLREIKRVELQVARVLERLEGSVSG